MKARVGSLLPRFNEWTMQQCSDAVLLQEYVEQRSDSSFRLLVERHGTLVWRACCRVLGSGSDAEDAFQATFLCLAQRADRIRQPDRLVGWLFGTALRIARKVHRSKIRRCKYENQLRIPQQTDLLEQLSTQESLLLLDEELEQLPEVYRVPLLLCFWEGLTQKQAALRLGWSEGSVKGRLERGRQRLQDRLRKRGFEPSILLLPGTGIAFRNKQLLANTIQFASRPWSSSISSNIASLVMGETSSRLWITCSSLFLVLSIAALGWMQIQSPTAENKFEAQVQQLEKKDGPKFDAFGDPLPPGALQRFGSIRFQHGNQISSLALHPDGKTIVTSGHGTLRWFDANTGQILGTWKQHNQHLFATRFSKDGNYLVLCGGTNRTDEEKEIGYLYFFDWPTKKVLWHKSFSHWVRDCDLSPDGKHVGLSCDDGLLQILDSKTGKLHHDLDRKKAFGGAVRFSPDGKWLAAGNEKKQVQFWDVEKGALGPVFENDSIARTLAFSPDGKTIAVSKESAQRFENGEIYLWDVATQTKLRTFPSTIGTFLRLVISPDGKYLAAGGDRGKATIWDLTSGQKQYDLEDGTSWIYGLQFSFDNTRIYIGSTNGLVMPWDQTTGKALCDPTAVRAGVSGVTQSPNRQWLATGNWIDKRFRIWDLSTGRIKKVIKTDQQLLSAFFTNDNSQVITAGDSNSTLHWIDWRDGKEIRKVQLGNKADWQARLAISRDGQYLAVGGVKKLWLLEANTGKTIREIPGHEGYIVDLQFSDDGRYIVSAAHSYSDGQKHHADWSVRVWSVATGKELFKSEGLYPNSPQFMPDGQSITFTNSNKRKIFDFLSHKERKPLIEKSQEIVYSPAGAWLVHSDEFGKIHVCDSETEQSILSFEADTATTYRLVWNADRRSFFSSHGDDTILRWDLTPIEFRNQPPRTISKTEAETLWADLDSKEAKVAYRAYWQLLTAPNAGTFLKDHLHRVDVDEISKQIVQSISDLSNDRFAVREQASKNLITIGQRARAALKEVRRTTTSAEVQQRVEQILKDLAIPKVDYRFLRCLEVLEAINNQEAKELLKDLARGDKNHEQTIRAAATLKKRELTSDE